MLSKKPPVVPKKQATARAAIRFTDAPSTIQRDDEEDFMIDEDSENEGSEQVERMQSLENARNYRGKRNLKSSYVKRPQISSASTRVVDLTDDQISYGIRPSTAICLD
jgi:hypothetical protein